MNSCSNHSSISRSASQSWEAIRFWAINWSTLETFFFSTKSQFWSIIDIESTFSQVLIYSDKSQKIAVVNHECFFNSNPCYSEKNYELFKWAIKRLSKKYCWFLRFIWKIFEYSQNKFQIWKQFIKNHLYIHQLYSQKCGRILAHVFDWGLVCQMALGVPMRFFKKKRKSSKLLCAKIKGHESQVLFWYWYNSCE